MDSGQAYRESAFPNAERLTENEQWRPIDPMDAYRIDCDRKHLCGEQAIWASKSVLQTSYVCDYHRRVYDATGTLFQDDSIGIVDKLDARSYRYYDRPFDELDVDVRRELREEIDNELGFK
jgi:hypothetical protein